MELEFATTEQLVEEMEKRPNLPFILILNNAQTNISGVHWNPKSFPTVFHVLHEMNNTSEQLYRYLYYEFRKWGIEQSEQSEEQGENGN